MNAKKIKKIPADGFVGLKQNFTKDALSGFLVFLLALPLSLGIAKASDFPAIFGLVTAIIGGVFVSFFSGTLLSIKGPAAGLIVIASGAVGAYGGGLIGWHLALGAVVVAGFIQVLFGLFKLGGLADFFPASAIHGMLAAIGVIIMAKQIHILLGIDPATLNGLEPLELLARIPRSLVHENAHITEIGIACLVLLFGFGYIKNAKIKKIPAPLMVLIVAIPLGQALHIHTEGAIANFSLVKIGSIFDVYKDGLIQVDFAGIKKMGVFVQYVILFSLIGSIESLLTSKAIDGMDPYKRKSAFNKDLMAVGGGNMLAGMLGGMPMISEVARSSANVINGAQTRWANFFHGLFLLIAVLFMVPFIEMIPNAALAAMLIYVGFKLAHPKEFMHMWKLGKEPFFVFVVTLIITLATDLLIGIGAGILLKLILTFLRGAKPNELFKAKAIVVEDAETTQMNTQGSLVFTNLIGLKKKILAIQPGKMVVLNLAASNYIDNTTMEALHEFQHDYNDKGGNFNIVGLEQHKVLGHAKTSARQLV
ncbi:MAG: SulP family inorganic anion transporter [Crocinitomicaceae bacterium]